MTDEGRRCFSLSPKRETTRSGGPPRVVSSPAEPEGGGGGGPAAERGGDDFEAVSGFTSVCGPNGRLYAGSFFGGPSGVGEAMPRHQSGGASVGYSDVHNG